MRQERVYFPRVPQDLVYPLKRGLARPFRWIGALTPTEKPERVLNHQIELYDLSYDVYEKFATLREEFDWDGPTGIIAQETVHDIGEIIKDDLALSRYDYWIIRRDWKREERLAAHWIFRKFIGDPETRKTAQAAYDRNYYCAPGDKEAHMAKMLNMVQGVRFGLKHVYDGNYNPSETKVEHVGISIEAFFKYAGPLVRLVSEDALPEMMEFLTEELERYRASGYPEIADTAIQRLNEISESRNITFAENANV